MFARPDKPPAEHINYILDPTRFEWTYLIMRSLITLVNVFMARQRLGRAY